jgi:hypothetical protein
MTQETRNDIPIAETRHYQIGSNRMSLKAFLRNITPKPLKAIRRNILEWREIMLRARSVHPRHCPFCGYRGAFKYYGNPVRPDAKCPSCGSLERTRMFFDWYLANKDQIGEPILHFAPEHILEERYRKLFTNYRTADLFVGADLKLDIQKIDQLDNSYSTIFCNHVLEHVEDDTAAMKELLRILKPGGKLFVSVPMISGWDTTYEDASINTPELRAVHFGQDNHLRYYGADFPHRLAAAGFDHIETITAEGHKVVEMGLMRGEKFFIAHKAA